MMDYTWLILILLPVIFLIWLGSFFLRTKPVIQTAMNVFFPFFLFIILYFIISLIDQIEYAQKWDEPLNVTSVLFSLFPVGIMAFFIFIITYTMKDAILIYNIHDHELSKALKTTLKKLKLEYDRDFTYINIKKPPIKIKIGMFEQFKSANVLFKNVEPDNETLIALKDTFKNYILKVKTKPDYKIGFVYILLGLMLPIPMVYIILI